MTIDWSKTATLAIGAMVAKFNHPKGRGHIEFIYSPADRGRYREGPASWEYIHAPAETESAQWDGEGLPPVGIEVEAMLQGLGSTTYFWQLAKVVHGPLKDSPGEVLVFSLETTRPAWLELSELRPIRTAEQIAEEAHRKEVEELGAATDWILNREACEAVLAAGYRKQVQP